MKNINPFETNCFISLHFFLLFLDATLETLSFFLPFVCLAVFYISYCHLPETLVHLTLQREQHVFNLHTLSKCISYKHPYQYNIYSRGKLIKLWM